MSRYNIIHGVSLLTRILPSINIALLRTHPTSSSHYQVLLQTHRLDTSHTTLVLTFCVPGEGAFPEGARRQAFFVVMTKGL